MTTGKQLAWYTIQKKLIADAREGFRYSELSKFEKAVADSLINKGRLSSFPTRDGDHIVNL